ncbi:MAG: hypothetical protein ACK4RV_02285 [Caulobacter sp.]
MCPEDFKAAIEAALAGLTDREIEVSVRLGVEYGEDGLADLFHFRDRRPGLDDLIVKATVMVDDVAATFRDSAPPPWDSAADMAVRIAGAFDAMLEDA